MAAELTLLKPPKIDKRIGKPRMKGNYTRKKLGRDDYFASIGIKKDDALFAALTEEELQFVCEMITNGCIKNQAYSSAYQVDCSVMDAELTHKIDSLLNRNDIKQALRIGIQKKMSEALDNLDSKLLNTYITRAFYDPSDFIDDDGEPHKLSNIPPNLRCVVDGIEKKYFGKDADAYTITYKLANRDSALKTLSEYMSIVRPKVEVDVTTPASSVVDESINYAEMTDEELKAELSRMQA